MPYSSVRSDEDPDGSLGSNQIIEPLAGRPDINAEKVEDESMWVPFFLRPTTLFAFSASLTTIGLALGILAWYSAQHQGICAAGDRQYYAWTYGPTAVFTLFGVFWNQIDYRTRLLMPWITMAKGLQPVERSVLLDHISPNIMFAWLQSWKSQDYPVAFAITGTLLIRVLIVLSAGLFTFISVETRSSPVSAYGGLSFSADFFNISQVNGQAIARVYGINSLDLSYPLCTNESIGSEIPEFQDGSNSTIGNIAYVDFFDPILDCEFGTLETINNFQHTAVGPVSGLHPDGSDITFLPWVNQGTENFEISIRLSSPSCPSITASGIDYDPIWTINSEGLHLSCSDDSRRFVIGFINSFDERVTNIINHHFGDGLSLPWLKEVSALLVCKPDYFIRQAELRFNPLADPKTNRSTVHLLDPAQNRKLGNITGWDLFDAFNRSLDYVGLFDTLNATFPQDNTTKFLDQEILHSTFERIYQATVVQISNIYLLEKSEQEFQVAELQLIGRIQLRGPAFWMTEIIIITLVLICLNLSKTFRKGYVLRDPGPISGIISILQSSQSLRTCLKGSGTSSLEVIREKLTSISFKTYSKMPERDNSAYKFGIQALHPRCTTGGQIRKVVAWTPSTPKWYSPLIMWVSARIVLICWATALLVSLESMYGISYRDNGLFTASERPYTEYYFRYIPVITLLFFGTAIGALDFEIKTLEPFNKLRRGPAPATVTMNENYLGRVGFHALWTAVRKRQWCTAATTIGMVLSPFLTILASGLYYTDMAFHTSALSFQQVDYFDFHSFKNFQGSAQTNGVMVANLVINDNMNLPDWTYSEFAIPKIHHDVDPLHPQRGAYIEVSLPAIRPVANCTLVTPKVNWDGDFPILEFPSLPACGDNAGAENNEQSINPPPSLHNNGTFGQWADRSGSEYHCPEYFAVVGRFAKIANTTNLTELTTLHCSPYLERLDATINLTYPELHAIRKIGNSSTPSGYPATTGNFFLNESTKQHVSPVEILDLGTGILKPYIAADELAALGDVDGFFGTLVRNGASLSEFLSDPAALQKAVEELYPRIVTQVVNANRETSISSTDAAESEDLDRMWNATLYQPNQLRLHQSALSTHALTALLSIMSICIATTFLMRTKEVLPKNPRSIAAVASLLAGSKLLERWPECRDEGFSMGYWRDESVKADQAEANGDGDEGAEDGATEGRAVSERADSETDGQETNVSELAESDFADSDGAGDETAETAQNSSEGIENELSMDEAGNLNVEVTEEDDRGEEAAMMEAGKANLRFGIDIGTPDET